MKIAENKLTRNQKRKRDYTAMAGKVETRSDKRRRLKAARVQRLRPRSHPYGNCGNVGCARCFPDLNAYRAA